MNKNIRVFTIMTTGRTGSDYLQCCLDNVPGVLTLTGQTYFKKFFKLIGNKDNFDVNYAIDVFLREYKNLFKGDELENKKINIDQNFFKKKFLKNISNNNIDKKNFILNIFFTFELCTRNKLGDVKAIVNHSHSLDETKFFLKLFPNSKLLITIRDPLENLRSGIKNWQKFTQGKLGQDHNFFYIKRILKDIEYSINLKNEKFFIPLEKSYKFEEKKKLVRFLGVVYSDNIEVATCNGIPWVGDKISLQKTNKGTFNKNILVSKIRDFFTERDIFLLRIFYSKYQKFGYIKNVTFNYKQLVLYVIYAFLPLSFEKKEILNRPFKISSYYYYFRRILLFLKILN